MPLLKGIGLSIFVLALAAMPAMADVVVVVSSKSAVTTLSKNQISDIFLGKTARFPDGSPAVPIDRTEGEAVRDEFYSKFTGKSAEQITAYWSRIIFTGRGQPPKEVANSVAIKKLILGNPAAIGYIETNLLDDTIRAVKVTGQ
jgi:ABC-type phosphate transport system substrate-binding protein